MKDSHFIMGVIAPKTLQIMAPLARPRCPRPLMAMAHGLGTMRPPRLMTWLLLAALGSRDSRNFRWAGTWSWNRSCSGVIGSGCHSWRNQNKNATDFTDLLKNSRSCAGAGRSSSNVSSARLFESVKSVKSVAFLPFSPIRSESGGKLLTPTSDYTEISAKFHDQGPSRL